LIEFTILERKDFASRGAKPPFNPKGGLLPLKIPSFKRGGLRPPPQGQIVIHDKKLKNEREICCKIVYNK
jgi:hypothetical protein